jgi:hypothetical protein
MDSESDMVMRDHCDEQPKGLKWLKLQLLRRVVLAKYTHLRSATFNTLDT